MRPGNLFAESIMCLDAKTGKRVGISDAASWSLGLRPPCRADPNRHRVGGRTVKALAQVTKQAFTFVLVAQTVTGLPDRRAPKVKFPASGIRRRDSQQAAAFVSKCCSKDLLDSPD
jgi:hypothetical protein